MRVLEELIEKNEPAWPLVTSWIGEAHNPVEVLARDEERCRAALLGLQVTTRSPMGAIAYESGGLLVDNGWLRILGGGSARLSRSITDWNARKTNVAPGSPPEFLLVADDVLGGFFAVDGGGLTGSPGSVHYGGPDSFEWENLELSYTSFVRFALFGDLERFYGDFRWPGWREEIAELSGDRAFSIYPFLWAEGPPIAERSRRAVPIGELWEMRREIGAQLRESDE
ncbi:MAG: DUF2625 domain-containing protein [Myxococcota bacterium]